MSILGGICVLPAPFSRNAVESSSMISSIDGATVSTSCRARYRRCKERSGDLVMWGIPRCSIRNGPFGGYLLVSKSVDRVERGGLAGRIVAEHHPHQPREDHRDADSARGQEHRPVEEGGQAVRDRHTGNHPDEAPHGAQPVSYTHLRAHETPEHLVCRL